MNEQERLTMMLIGDGTSYQNMLNQAQVQTSAAANRMTSSLNSVSSGIGQASSMFGMLGASVMGMLGIATTFQAVKSSFSLAAEFEQNEIAFGTMLQSAEKGKALVKELQNFASVTPMTTRDLLQASRTLLQFGKSAGVAETNVVPLLKTIGDVTGGNSQKFQMMSLAFGQMLGTGRLMGQDLNQMINAGFNPMQELAKITGKTSAQLMDMKEKGQISSRMVVKAFESATAAGGSFHGMMEQQSQSVSGMFSTLQDNIQIALQNIGQTMIDELDIKGLMKTAIKYTGELANWFMKLSPEIKRAAAAVVLVVVGIVALKVAFIAAGIAFNLAFGGIGIILGLIVMGIGALVGWAGGLDVVKEKWQQVKEVAQKAWDWLKPVRQAVTSFLDTVWRRSKELWEVVNTWATGAWSTIRQKASDAWRSIFGDASINWGKIRDEIRDTILFAEFMIVNLGDVWRMTMTYAHLQFVRWTSRIEHFFMNTMPVLTDYFLKNWKTIGLVFSKLMTGDIAGFAAGITGVTMEVAKDLPERVKGDLEKSLEEDMKQKMEALGEKWDAFREKKLQEFAQPDVLPPEAVEKAKQGALEVGNDMGKNLTKGVKDNLKNMDAALFGSAEALARMIEYRNKVDGTGGGKRDPRMGAGFAVANAGIDAGMRAIDRGVNPPGGRKDESVQILNEIKGILEKQANKDLISVESINLT